MKIIDTSVQVMWNLRRRSSVPRVGPVEDNPAMKSQLRKLHRISTTTIKPGDTNFYAEGRSNLAMYKEGFATIKSFTDAYSTSLQSARMTDQEIESLIERMNLTPR